MSAMAELKLTPANNAAIRQWNQTPCGALDDDSGLDLAYFEAVERNRYDRYAPWMRQTVGFEKYRGKRLLGVGVGLGAELAQFVKNGAEVYGVDITPRLLELVARNFEVRGLKANLQRAV